MKHNVYHMAVAVIARNSRGRVIERALTRFKSEEHYEEFKRVVYKKFLGYEIYSVHIRDAQPPSGEREGGKLWCPYCSSWNTFFAEDGYTKCEICCISTRDFYTARYNKAPKLIDGAGMNESDKEKRRLRREKRKQKIAK
jgi:hypothetical protein